MLRLLAAVSEVPGVERVFVGSGLRMDLLPWQKGLFREIAARHVSGRLKVAPEHVDPGVLRLMRKPGAEVFTVTEIRPEGKARRAAPGDDDDVAGGAKKGFWSSVTWGGVPAGER